METTKELLKNYTELRDAIVANGIDSRRRVIRQLLNVAMQGHQLQEDYLLAKARNPEVYIKFLEPAKAYTAAQRRNLEKANAVNKEIGKLLGASRKRRKKAINSQ